MTDLVTPPSARGAQPVSAAPGCAPIASATPAASRVKNVAHDISSAIPEGEPFVDDFIWSEAEWTRVAAQRFEDRQAR